MSRVCCSHRTQNPWERCLAQGLRLNTGRILLRWMKTTGQKAGASELLAAGTHRQELSPVKKSYEQQNSSIVPPTHDLHSKAPKTVGPKTHPSASAPFFLQPFAMAPTAMPNLQPKVSAALQLTLTDTPTPSQDQAVTEPGREQFFMRGHSSSDLRNLRMAPTYD